MEFFLDFYYPDGTTERDYITEPPGYDAFAYRVKQGDFRLGRDKTIGGEEIGITLWDATGEESAIPYINQSGRRIYYKTHALDKVIALSRAAEQGFEARIEFGVTDGTTQFVNGQFDTAKSKTDEKTYFTCNVVQNTKLAQIERKKNVNVDVFSTTDLYGNPVTPCPTYRMLQKAKSVVAYSTLSSPANVNLIYNSYGLDAYIVNSAQQIDNADIEDTYNPFATSEYIGTGFTDAIAADALNRFKLLVAREDLSNLTINLDSVNLAIVDLSGSATNKELMVSVGLDPVLDKTEYPVIASTTSTINVVNGSYVINIPFIPRGFSVWLYASVTTTNTSPSSTPVGSTSISMGGMSVKVKTESTAVDRVINVCSYPEFLKAGIERLSGLPFNCPDLESTGKFGNLYVYSGYMQRSIPNKPFNFIFEDQFGHDMRWLGNSDYEITNNGVDHGDYDFFYPNVDLGGFLDAPDVDFERTINERFQLQTWDTKFANYNKDDRSANTIDSFQTEAQQTFPNGAVENRVELNIKNIWDAFEQEKNAIQGLRKTTGLDFDDKVSIVDVVDLAPGATGTIRGFYTFYTKDGKVLIYNKPLNGFLSTQDSTLAWDQVGISVGDVITFDAGDNIGAQSTVLDITPQIITLQPINYVAALSGTAYFVITHAYTGVLLTNRTSENFDQILNLQSGNNCSNLKYTIARMNQYFYSYWNTVCSAHPTKDILTTKFVNNDQLITQFMGGRVLREGENIPVSRLDPKVLTIDVYKTRVYCSFQQATALFNSGLRGTIRIYNKNNEIKRVHLADCAMLWRDEILEINKGEVRDEPTQKSIVSVSGGIEFNGVFYTTLDWWEISNGYFAAYDPDRILLAKPVRFGEVLLNGVLYEDENDFRNALIVLLA